MYAVHLVDGLGCPAKFYLSLYLRRILGLIRTETISCGWTDLATMHVLPVHHRDESVLHADLAGSVTGQEVLHLDLNRRQAGGVCLNDTVRDAAFNELFF
jgi:hypothetical protein